MKLIFLYGPPASGKKTIGKLLADKTGYGFIDNHTIIDLATKSCTFKTPQFFELCHNLREALFVSHTTKKGLITTFGFPFEGDAEYVWQFTDVMAMEGIQVKFVKIVCDEKQLFKRINNPSRKGLKIKNKEHLQKFLSTQKFGKSISGVRSFTIDSSKQSPVKNVTRICQYFNLKVKP